MSEEEHLMDRKDFEEFINLMWQELVRHKDEKAGLKYMHPQNVYSISMIEIKKRVAKMLMQDPKEIMKQDVHCANYLFFMWIKMREMLKEKK